MDKTQIEKLLTISNNMVELGSELMIISPEKLRSLILKIKELEIRVQELEVS